MQKSTLSFLLFTGLLLAQPASAQQNCSNPVLVELCSTGTLLNQTNAGMLNDFPSACNISGEDLVYKLHASGNNTRRIFVSVMNATGTLRVSLQTACGSGSCLQYSLSSGNSNISFIVSP